MDEITPLRHRRTYQMLKANGVQGKNLTKLAAADAITPELIESKLKRIHSAGPSIRNPAAVLVRSLEDHAGLKLRASRSEGNLSPQDLSAITKIEEMKRNRQRDAS